MRQLEIYLKIFLGFFIFLPFLSISQENLTEEELFQKVFGTPPKQEIQEFMAILAIDGIKYDFILVSLLPDDIEFNSTIFLMVLKDNVTPMYYEQVTLLVDKKGHIKASSLEKLGYEVFFNHEDLSLRIEIPADIRMTKEHYVSMRSVRKSTDIIYPDAFSAYLNMSASQYYRHNTKSQTTRKFLPFGVNFKSVVNFKGMVWENFFNYKDRREHQWQHTDQRLIYDVPSKMWRFTFGDTSIRTAGFATSSNIGGISFNKDFSLQPYSVTSPVHDHEIFLERPSKVEIYVNDNKVRSFNFDAGTHNLVNFPAMLGSNEADIKIIDEFGNESWLEFPFIHETSLLNPGTSRYSYNFGFQKKTVEGHIEYDTKKWLFSMFRESGINDSLTLGGYFQTNNIQSLGGVTGATAIPFGCISFDIAGSLIHSTYTGFALRTSFNNYTTHDLFENNTSFNFSTTYFSRTFALIGNEEPDNNAIFMFSSSIGRRLSDDVSASIGGNFEIDRVQNAIPYRVFLGIGKTLYKESKRFWKDLDISINFTYNRKVNLPDEFEGYINASWSIPFSDHSITTSYNTSSSRRTLDWTYSPEKTFSSKSTYIAHLSQDSSKKELGLDYGYNGHLGNVRLSTSTGHSNDSTTNEASVFASTAIAFAGGHFGISRPISNSFILVAPNKIFSDKIVYINPNADRYLSKSTRISSAIISNLSAYQQRSIFVDIPNIPIGYDAGKNNFTFLPSNKSGTSIVVGTDSTIFLSGRLIDQYENPLSLQAGYITKTNDPKWDSITFFTNRNGKFRVLGLSPGKYYLKFFSSEFEDFHFEIPKKAKGSYDLGENIIEKTGKLHENN